MGYGIRLEVNPFSRKSSQVPEQAGWPATYDRLQQTTTTVDLAHGLEQAVLSPFQPLDLVVYENAAAEQLAQYRWQSSTRRLDSSELPICRRRANYVDRR